MIYFIKQGDYVKIGYTDNIRNRIMQLQTSSPIKLRLIGLIDGTLDDESEYHKRFNHLRSSGEWFSHTQGLENFINTLKKDLMYEQGYLGIEEEFTRIYNSFNYTALNIDNGMSYKLLFWILDRNLSTTIINIGTSQLLLFNNFLKDNGCKEISKATYYRCVSELCKSDVIIKIGKSDYYLNPKFIWKGTKSNREEALKYGLKINLDN